MLAAAVAFAALAGDGPLPLKDGAKVALLGSTLFERASNDGYWEAAALARHPGMNIRFRNFAWSGDTVRCQARSYFGPPQEGFDRLQATLEREKPNVIVCCYGANESAAGPAGLTAFVADYRRFIDMAKAAAPGARVLLVSHPPRPGGKPPIPNQTETNQQIAAYNAAAETLAREMGLGWADFGSAVAKHQRSDDGATLSDSGYYVTAGAFADLFLQDAKALVSAPPAPTPDDRRHGPGLSIPPGAWRIIDSTGKQLFATAKDSAGSTVHPKPDDRLRQAVLKKEQLAFNRWRPQNETYLFGFRKQEQGNNGIEIPQFDPLIARADESIFALMKEPSFKLEPMTEASK